MKTAKIKIKLDVTDPEFMMLVETVAEIAHQANKAYCESLGDDSHVDWDHCSKWQRESVIDGVLNIVENPDTTPEESHENWMSFKEFKGWTYGEEKNEEKKTHPSMVPYSDRDWETK